MNWDSFANDSKVWVYQSETPLVGELASRISEFKGVFLGDWESHGKKVLGDIQIVEDHFLVIIADPCGDTMCGRAQDAQVRLVKELEQELSLDLMNRLKSAVIIRDELKFLTMPEFQEGVKSGEISKSNTVYNNVITNYSEFQGSWKVPASDSWHARFF